MTPLPNSLSPDDEAIIQDLLAAHGFDALTTTQHQALEERILDGGNHLLVAETGNGKTLCAEAVTKQMLDAGGRVAYLVPSHQLVGAKHKELNVWADGEYDVRERGYRQADVAIATFDSFYQAILRDIGDVRSIDLVVLDDFHIIYDQQRGAALEKTIAAILDNQINIFAMSATVGNPAELADWMQANLVLSEQERSIEIEEHPILVDDHEGRKSQIVSHLQNTPDHAPFLMFNSSRRTAEARANALADTQFYAESGDRNFFTELQANVDGMQATEKLHDLATLMSRGVAYHHAGLPRSIRNWIEECFESEDIGAIFCTPTLAYGFDAPVQSVVVADLKRFTGTTMEYIHTYEYVQWIGRAARPGRGFEEGYAYPFYSNFDEASERFFGEKELEPVTSHVDSGDGLRWLILELVEMGWDTPTAIEDFLRKTLYWEQLTEHRAWDREAGDKLTRMQSSLRREVDWLEQFGFVREQQTTAQFEATRQGSAAVSFNFGVFRQYPLRDIHDLCTRLEDSETFTALQLLYDFAGFTDQYVSTDGLTDEIGTKLLQEDLIPDEDAAVVAGVFGWYWCQGITVGEIEERTNIDPTSVRMTARQLSRTLDAASALFDGIRATQPEWYDDLVRSVEKGVPREELPIVRAVHGVGRATIQGLREYFGEAAGSSNRAFEFESETLVGALGEAADQVEREDQFRDVLRGINGIGQARSKSLAEFARSQDGDSVSTPLFGENAAEGERGGTTSYSRNSSLQDFL